MLRQAVLQKIFFRLRAIGFKVAGNLRRLYWSAQGMRIGSGTIIPKMIVTWPHQIQLGSKCVLEPDTYFKFDGIWSPGPSIILENGCFIGARCEFNITKGVKVGEGSAIASGCKFIDHDHGTDGEKLDETPGPQMEITLGRHVWLGANVTILKGVTIGDGAVIGAGSVVTRSVPAREIWAGVPARKIRMR